MKKIIYLLFILLSTGIVAQNASEIQVKQTVDDFFKAFHAQDSMAIKKLVHPAIILQTIGTTKDGLPKLEHENFDAFIQSIINIPDSIRFQERLLDYTIQIDGPMATVWTPYEFWLNNEFHHCGVNSFHLLKETDTWRIIYLIDTRRKSGCTRPTE